MDDGSLDSGPRQQQATERAGPLVVRLLSAEMDCLA